MIPATIALGSFTYTMTAMPGSVQLPISFRCRTSRPTPMRHVAGYFGIDRDSAFGHGMAQLSFAIGLERAVRSMESILNQTR